MKPRMRSRATANASLAVFIDFENIGLGFDGRRDRFEIEKVLERLVEKGKIVAKKAYADWSRFGEYTRLAARGGDRADRDPAPRTMTGKNSADIRLVRGRHRPGVLEGPHRHVRDRVGRQRLLAAGVEAEGTRQARHRPRAWRTPPPTCSATTATSSSTTRTWTAPPIDAVVGGRGGCPSRSGRRSPCSWTRCWPCGGRTRRCIYSSMVKDTMKRKKPSFNEELPRLPDVQRAAGGRAERRAGRAGEAQDERHVRGDAVRGGAAGRPGPGRPPDRAGGVGAAIGTAAGGRGGAAARAAAGQRPGPRGGRPGAA